MLYVTLNLAGGVNVLYITRYGAGRVNLLYITDMELVGLLCYM